MSLGEDRVMGQSQDIDRQTCAQQPAFNVVRHGTHADAHEIRGVAAGRGSYSGVARVIKDAQDFDNVRSGDVLICPDISTSWSILFRDVRAVVADAGGILSNGAIIAREQGIPVVLATDNGTEVIRDGQQVVVDGDRGVVQLLN